MKNKIALLILSLFVFSQVAFAGSPMHKFARGFEGLLTAPMEYYNQYAVASEKEGVIASVVAGVVLGTTMTLKRVANAAYDIVTFPVKPPRDYGVLLKDDFETALKGYQHRQNAQKSTTGL